MVRVNLTICILRVMALTLFKKSQSPFILFQEQSDKLIKDINKDLKKCTSELKKKPVDEITKKYLGDICQRDLDKIAVEKEKLSQLTEESEPKPIQKFEIKKEEKFKKLHNLEIQVNDVYSMLDVNRQSRDPQTDKDKSEINAKKGGDSPKNLDGDDDDYDEEEEDEDDEDGDENDEEYNNGDVIKSLKTNLQSIKGLNDDLINEEDEEEEEEEEDDDDGKLKTSKSSEMDDNINTITNKSSEISQKKSVTLVTNKSDDDEEEGDDNYDSDDDDGEEEVANKTINLPDGENMFVAIKSFPGQEEGDLSFKKNEKLKVMNIRSDGWMMAENDKGEQGLVPGNFFEKFSDPQDEDDKPKHVEEKKHPDDDSDDDYDDDEEDEEEEDELINEPDEDIRVIKSAKVQKIKTKTHKGIDLWTQLKESVHLSEEKKIDLIKSLSSVPSGYREPTLSKLSTKKRFSLKQCMHPCLSISGLNYEDLTMDSQIHEVEHRKSKIQCTIDLISIRNLPLPTDISVIKILDRHVRVVLFDGKKFLSNFLVIKISIVEEYNWWKFNSHRNSPSSEFSQLFIRSNSLSPKLGVLFEVATMLQTEIETVELSCGWSFFKLLTDNGLPVPNRTYQLPMNGGTPYEKGIPIDKKSDQARSRKFSFVSVLNSIKDSPIFTIKLSSPKKSQNLHLESLPEMMIGQTSNLMFLFLYRQYLLDALIRYRNDLNSIEVFHSPLLTSLTEILEQPNLIDVLRTSWSEKARSLSRSEKKNPEVMKSSFLTVFMENVYPLMFLARLKKMNHHNILEWKNRDDEIQKFIKSQSGNKMSGLSLFTKPNVPLLPFDTQELTFNLLDSTLEK